MLSWPISYSDTASVPLRPSPSTVWSFVFFVAAHPLPVDGFRHDGGIGMFADNLIITAVRFRELLVHEATRASPIANWARNSGLGR